MQLKLADLWEVWSKHYEGEMEKSDFTRRKQSTTPEVACMALRRLANFFGRGRKVKKVLKTSDRLTYHLLKAIKGSKANKVNKANKANKAKPAKPAKLAPIAQWPS